jgi:hypothetical protein
MVLKKFKAELLEIAAFLCVFGAACSLSMSRFYSIFELAFICLIALFMITFIWGYHLELKQMKVLHLKQINGFILGSMAVVSLKLFHANTEKWFVNVFLIIWLAIAFTLLLRYYMTVRENEDRYKIKILDVFTNYKGIWIIFAVIILVGFYTADLEPKWDSGVVFRRMSAKAIDSMFYLQDLTISGHLNIAYVLGNIFNIEIFKNARIGMLFGNILVLIVGTIAFYKLLKMIVPGKGKWSYTLITSIFTFSPFLLGMIHLFCWDYWMICLFPVIVLTAYQKKWILHFGSALLFCFLKEPAIIIYGFFCVGILLYDIITALRKSSEKFKIVFIGIIEKPQYWLMCVVGICWVFLFVMLTHWNGGGSFGINFHYILNKLSVLYVLNFNWLFLILSIVSLIHFNKKSDNWQWMAPILLGDVAFVIFSCLFETSNHARYVDSHVSVMYLLTGALIIDLGKNILQKGMAIILSGLMLTSSFFTIDILSLKLFDTFDVGGGKIVTTGKEESISDATIYNFQYRGFEMALSEAICDVVGEAKVILPLVNSNVWYFDGISDFKQQNNFDETLEYWNTSRKVRRSMAEANTLEFPVVHISDEASLEEYLEPSTKYAYIYLTEIGSHQAENIRKDFEVLEERTFQNGIFVLTRIIFEVN